MQPSDPVPVRVREQGWHIAMLLAAGVILWGATSGLWDLHGEGEGRYVQIAKELQGGTNPFALTMAGVPYNQKPPLAMWWMAAMIWLCGGEVVNSAVRLPSVIAALANVVLVYLLGRHVGRGDGRLGLGAGLVFMSAPFVMESAAQAELNGQFTMWITLALTAWMMAPLGQREGKLSFRRALLFWGALAAATLTKGPLCLLIALPVVAVEAVAARSWRPLRAIRPLAGAVIVLGAGGVWLAGEASAYGWDFVARQLRGETVDRFASGSHKEPWWWYVPAVFAAFFPWMIVLCALRRLSRGSGTPAADRTRLRPLVVWMTVPFVFLSVASGKRANYLLPLVPAAAVLVAWISREVARQGPERLSRLGRGAARGGIVLAGAAAIGAGIILLAQPANRLFAGLPFPPAVSAVWIGAGIILWILSARGGRRMTALEMTAGALIILGTVRFATVEPVIDMRTSTREFAREIGSLGPGGIGAIGDPARPEYHVYGRYEYRQIFPRRFIAGKPADRPRWLLLDAEDFDDKQADLAAMGYGKRRVMPMGDRVFELYELVGYDRELGPGEPNGSPPTSGNP